MNNQKYLLVLFCLCFSAVPCFAKEWRNMFPLQTTRAEVLGLIGNTQQTDSEKGEFFAVDNNIVTFKWTKPDCTGEDAIISSDKANFADLVYQIKVEPKSGLQLGDLEPKTVEKRKKKGRIELLEAYKNWVEQDAEEYKNWMNQQVDCMSGKDDFICSVRDFRNGFVYSSSNAVVTALYYFPTEEQSKTWKETHKPCSVENQ